MRMKPMAVGSPAEWTADSLAADSRWTFSLSDGARSDVAEAVRHGRNPAKALIDYRCSDFGLSSATGLLAAACNEAQHGRGIALIRGLPTRLTCSCDGNRVNGWIVSEVLKRGRALMGPARPPTHGGFSHPPPAGGVVPVDTARSVCRVR
jgi:hypothetical protein